MQKFFISEPFIASNETGGFIDIGLEHSSNLISVSFGGPHHYHTVSEAAAAAQTICDALNGEPQPSPAQPQPDRLTIAAGLLQGLFASGHYTGDNVTYMHKANEMQQYTETMLQWADTLINQSKQQ